MIENTKTKDCGSSIFPPLHRNHAGFTEEEIQDIQRFIETYKIQGAAKTKLLVYLRDRRAARAIQEGKAESNAVLY